MKTNDADRFMQEPNNFRDTNHIMQSLDSRELEKQQDWNEGTTTWTFPDGSKIRVCGDDVDVIDAE